MKWENMTADMFKEAVVTSKRTCIVPIGIIEKHGTHLPLATDMIIAREIAIRASLIEPVVVFPYYYFGQVSEARHVIGTISIDPELAMKMLKEICKEISRNGFDKIIFLNGHGGNNKFLEYFIQTTLHESNPYSVYYLFSISGKDLIDKIKDAIGDYDLGGHGGNLETSIVMSANKSLVKMDNVEEEGLIDYDRLDLKEGINNPIWWYASHPTHMAGEPFHATKEAGDIICSEAAKDVAIKIRNIKEDSSSRNLLKMYYDECNKIAERN